MPFCPRCNESVTPVDNKCPGCQRLFASAKDAKVETGWASLLKAAQSDARPIFDGDGEPQPDAPAEPSQPTFVLSDDEIPEHWRKKKLEAEKPPPLPPKPVDRSPPIGPLLALAALGTVVYLFMFKRPELPAPPPVASISPAAPAPAPPVDPSKVVEEAVSALKQKNYARSSSLFDEAEKRGAKFSAPQRQSRKRAKLALSDELLLDARTALAAKNWNQAVALAEQAAQLNRAFGGNPQQRKKAESLVADVNSRLAEARTNRVEESPAGTTAAPGVQPGGTEQPKLDEGPAFPTSSYRAQGGRPTASSSRAASAAEPTTGQSAPARSAQATTPRAASGSGKTAPRLGDEGVVPTYSRTAAQPSAAPGYSSGSRFRR